MNVHDKFRAVKRKNVYLYIRYSNNNNIMLFDKWFTLHRGIGNHIHYIQCLI